MEFKTWSKIKSETWWWTLPTITCSICILSLFGWLTNHSAFYSFDGIGRMHPITAILLILCVTGINENFIILGIVAATIAFIRFLEYATQQPITLDNLLTHDSLIAPSTTVCLICVGLCTYFKQKNIILISFTIILALIGLIGRFIPSGKVTLLFFPSMSLNSALAIIAIVIYQFKSLKKLI